MNADDRDRRADERLRDWMLRTAPPAAPERILATIASAAKRTPQARPFGPLVLVASGLAAVAAAVLITIGALQGWAVRTADGLGEATMRAGGDTSTSASGSAAATLAPATPSASIASSPTPPASAAAVVDPWPRAVVEQPAANTARIYDAAVGQSGYVAVGGGGSVEGLGGALAWHSADGQTWSLVLDGNAASDGSAMNGVVATEDGFVAVGRAGSPRSRAAAWRSTDGTTWADAGEAGVPANASDFTAVATGGTGLMAVGFTSEAQVQGAGAWRSGDGTTWEALTAPDSYVTGRPHDVALADHGSGWIIGSTGPDPGSPVAWPVDRAAVGEAIRLGDAGAETAVTVVIAAGSGFLAAGQRWEPALEAYSLVAWEVGPDGVWHEISPGPVGTPFGGLSPDRSRVVLVGQTFGMESSEVAVWERGTDGWHTSLIEDSNGTAFDVVARPDGRLVVVGADGPDGSAIVWLEP